MISQWVQMEKECLVSLEEVECAIGNIVNRVRQIVNAKSNDSHAKTDVNDPEVARNFFAVMKDVLYKEMQFSCVEIGEDLFSFQNMCVEKVNDVYMYIYIHNLIIPDIYKLIFYCWKPRYFKSDVAFHSFYL